MKSFLSVKQMTILIQALVVSALDYCNALYYGIDTVFINQLQVCQNRACRVIFGLKKRDSVTQHLKSLHWLKIRERVDFKVLLLVYKCLNGLAPEYLSELLQYNNLSGSRCPSLKSSITATQRGSRAFQASAFQASPSPDPSEQTAKLRALVDKQVAMSCAKTRATTDPYELLDL